jgi:hypothetical protein
MPEHNGTDEHRDTRPAKKRYEKPTFQSEQLFETMALSCGKISSTQGACHAFHKAS